VSIASSGAKCSMDKVASIEKSSRSDNSSSLEASRGSNSSLARALRPTQLGIKR